MPGKVFFRERTSIEEGDKMPRFLVVAVADVNLKIHAKHLRKDELKQIADSVGAELVELSVEDKGHKTAEAEVEVP
ncbi:MAG: hypothetical protein WBI63_03945 [Coriobacteriia bacterium]